MTFKTALLISVFALTLGSGFLAASAFAADSKVDSPAIDAAAFNQADPKFKSEQERLSDSSAMDAAILSRATCPTGVCHKDTSGDVGFDTTPILVPTGDAVKSTDATGSATKK